jgi:HD superfamily phosphohydrolase
LSPYPSTARSVLPESSSAASGAAGKSRAVRYLAQSEGPVRIYPGLQHDLSRAERLVIETRSMQRMTRLRQTGLAYLTCPTSEHTRLVHCIGTSYWSVRFLAQMRAGWYGDQVGDRYERLPGIRARLEFLDAMLGPDLSLDLLIRLYAVTHDSDLLPFGHTLSYQLGYYPPPGTIPRYQRYVRQIAAETRSAPLLQQLDDGEVRAEVLACLDRHLEAVEAVAASVNLLAGRPARHLSQPEPAVAALLPVYTFVETLVTATVSADLLDFSLRDTLGAATPWHFDGSLLDAGCVYATAPGAAVACLEGVRGPDGAPVHHLFRFGFRGVRGGQRQHATISGVCELLRVRYQVLEQIVFSRGKCVADAMLDKAIRNLNAHHAGEPVPEQELLVLGDDEFLDLVGREELKASLVPGCQPVLDDLRARRLFAEAYRLEDPARLSESGRRLLSGAGSAIERDMIEEKLLGTLPDLTSTDVAICCLPLTMQMKEPTTLVGWDGGEVLPLGEVAATSGCGAEALAITKQYANLWAITVYTRHWSEASRAAVRDASVALFEG